EAEAHGLDDPPRVRSRQAARVSCCCGVAPCQPRHDLALVPCTDLARRAHCRARVELEVGARPRAGGWQVSPQGRGHRTRAADVEAWFVARWQFVTVASRPAAGGGCRPGNADAPAVLVVQV